MTTRKAAKLRDRIAYLVLGMHRSGTSAVTQLLALAGAELPANVMPGDEHNARGYFEPWKVAVFNDERLRAAGGGWDDVFGFPYRPLAADDEAAWRRRAHDLFVSEYGAAGHPLLKDPRVSVLAPMWLGALEDAGVKARAVIPLRHPLAVAGSLTRRDGFAVEKSVLLWATYMLAAEFYSRGLPRAFVDYDALLTDWRTEVGALERALGESLPKLDDEAASAIDAFLSPDLRHNAGAGDLTALGWTGALAQQVMDALAPGAKRLPVDTAALDAASAELVRRRDEFGMLVSPAVRDVGVLKTELEEAREAARVLAEQIRDDREVLESGWRADLAQQQAAYTALEDQLRDARAQLHAAHGRIDDASRRLDEIIIGA